MSSSESDDETFDAQPTARSLKQNQKVPSRNEQYQNLVNAKNKFSEMLKNKIKQSERTSITLSDDYEFNPVASSTQINTPDELKREKNKQKKAGTPFKLTNLLNTDKSTIKQKRFKENEVINISSTIVSSSSNSESDEDSLPKPAQSTKNKNAGSSEDSKFESSSGSNSDSSTNGVNQIRNKKNIVKSSKLENSPRHSNSKRKSSVSSDESSENDKSHSQSTFSGKQKKKVVQKSSSGSQSDSQEEENSNYNVTKNSRFNVEKHSKSNLKQESSGESSDSETESNYRRHPTSNMINKFSKGNEAKGSFRNNPLKIQNVLEESSSYSSSDEFVERKITPSIVENTPISRLKNYEEESSFQKISGANDFLRDIKSNEEIFLVQVPIKIDPQSLVGVNISLSEAIRIPQRKKYDSVPVSEAPGNVALFCNSTDDRIRIVKPVRYIKIQRRLKNKTVVEVPEVADQSVSFPHNLKQRHPLFGSEFANKIQLEEHVKQKLEAAQRTHNIKIKKKEKKKKMQGLKKEEDQKEEIFKLLNQSISSVAPTISKSNEKLQFSEDNDDAREKRHKKKKKKSGEVEEDLSNLNAKKKKKKSKEYQSSEDESRIDGKKRKNVDLDTSNSSQKKSKNDSENDSLIKQLLSLENASLYKKKKKKRKIECQDE